MAEASKPAKDPVLEQKFLSFLRERIGLHETLSIKNLTGHLSALSPRVRSHFGSSRSCLKQFLTDHPKDFHVDKKDNVKLVSRESSSASETATSEHHNDKPANSKPSPTPEKPVSAPSKESIDFPNELVEVRGKVYRLFPAYGFISVNSPIVCSVYFNVNCFENGRGKGKDGAIDIAVGEGVFLNAKKGPNNVEAQYRATKVWRVEPPTRQHTTSESSFNMTWSSMSSPVASTSSKGSLSNTSNKKEIYGSGKIDNLFMKFGFISQNNMVKDNVFFHLKTLHKPGCKNMTNLLDVLKLGDTVNFSAIPTEQKNTQVRWQATRVWTRNEEGSEIYYSSPEGSIASSSVESLPLVSSVGPLSVASKSSERKSSSQHSENHLNCVGDQLESCSTLVDRSNSKASPVSNSSSLGSKPSVMCQVGTIWPNSEQMGKITFGNDQKALVLVDVFYHCEERIENFLWEVEDGQRIQFEALEDTSWAPEYPWKATLAWVGRKPEVSVMSLSQMKDTYSRIRGEPVDSNDGWGEQENVPQDVEDDEDEDFIEENLEDDVLNDDKYAGNSFNNDHIPSDLSGNEGNDYEDDGFEENMENFPLDSISSGVSQRGAVENTVQRDLKVDSGYGDVSRSSETFPAELSNSKDTCSSQANPLTTGKFHPNVNCTSTEKPKMSTSWAEITEDDDLEAEILHSEATLRMPVESTAWLPKPSSSVFANANASITSEPKKVEIGATSLTTVEQRLEELTGLVQDLLQRVPTPKLYSDQSTQTELPSASAEQCNSLPRPSTMNQEAQTVSTGPLMYTQLYYSQ